jgi:hypothetical protein
MIKATKITDEELQEVQQLQKDFQIVTYQIGELSIAYIFVISSDCFNKSGIGL